MRYDDPNDGPPELGTLGGRVVRQKYQSIRAEIAAILRILDFHNATFESRKFQNIQDFLDMKLYAVHRAVDRGVGAPRTPSTVRNELTHWKAPHSPKKNTKNGPRNSQSREFVETKVMTRTGEELQILSP